MRIGYSQWNFLSDTERDSPGGGNFYISDFIHECFINGIDVIMLQEDRDRKRAAELGKEIHFGDTFLPGFREKIYQELTFDLGFPEIDLLLIEYRWPIEGRNTLADRGKPGYTPDLERQTALLEHYSKTNTKIVLWDLDHKITSEDEKKYPNAHIIETSVVPRTQYTVRHRVHIPFYPEHMQHHQAKDIDPNWLACYVGNYYERDSSIEEYLVPIADAFPGKVHLIGNWRKYPDLFKKIESRWPNFKYHDRIAKDQFLEYYGKSLTCPLLAKDTYNARGFFVARYLEALYFRCLPVGFGRFFGLEHYLQPNLISGRYPSHYSELIENLLNLSAKEREEIFQYQFTFLDPFHPRHFLDTLGCLMAKETQRVPGFCIETLEKDYCENMS